MTAKNHYSNFSSKPKSIKFYRLDEFPEAIFLVEAESVDKSVDKTKKTEDSLRGIIFPLGMIAISIVLSVFQLYRALEVTPSSPNITKFRDSATIAIPKSKFDRSQNYQIN